MNYLLLISQKNYLALGHIMAEISTVKKTKWPEKFKCFEIGFLGFKKQRMESKLKVGAIMEHETLNGFLQTLVGYENMVDACLNASKKGLNRFQLLKSKKLMESLKAEINTQLAEQGFNVK